MDKISVIVPCFNEQETVKKFYEVAVKTLKSMDVSYEIIFVDDGSKDQTLARIKQLEEADSNISHISFSRNFGKEAALYAGLKESTGDYTAVMDADLQDPPEMLVQMYDIVKTGEYDCAAAKRSTRSGEPLIRSFFAKCFYRLINRISDTHIVSGARDFRLMSRGMVNAVLSVSEYNRFSKGIFEWVGFKTKWLDYVNLKRYAGSTKWSFYKLLKYSVDGITDFSSVPLAISSFIGIGFCLIAFIMICVIIIKTVIWGDPVGGWPSLACIIFFVGGVQLFCTGIIGGYLSKTYLETKKRPLYIIKEQKLQRQENDPENTRLK